MTLRKTRRLGRIPPSRLEAEQSRIGPGSVSRKPISAHASTQSCKTQCTRAWHDRDSRGSVYLFEKNPDGEWTEIQKLAPDDARRSQSDFFHGNYGYTVALSQRPGGIVELAVKAPYDSYTGSYDYEDPNRGVVYVYARGEDGLFAQTDRLFAPEGTQVRTHLTDVLFLEAFLLVGAPGRNRVYVFERADATETGDDEDAGHYRKAAELVPSDNVQFPGVAPEFFGVGLSGAGEDVLVAERGGRTSYLFSYGTGDGGGGVWKERARFDAFNAALSGTTVVEHAPTTFGEIEGSEGRYGGAVHFYRVECE